MNDFKKVLASVEAAYSKVQNGALGRTVLKSEGASSYTVTVRAERRATTSTPPVQRSAQRGSSPRR